MIKELSIQEKAKKYDELVASAKVGGKKSAAKLTPEQRSARAKKAVQARIDKLGQNRVK
jgi:hypothetical protein